ncbi:hypothetical protein [Streptomyces sp. AM 2-1-1]|uniref:DUF6197 family protein n=1 Tax=Streptomyces sp. AM 2-1-1 TaxID=3028709 RepID=UPI0031BBA135
MHPEADLHRRGTPMDLDSPVLTPDELDLHASRLQESDLWQRIVTGWDHSAPEPVRLRPADDADPVPRASLAVAPAPPSAGDRAGSGPAEADAPAGAGAGAGAEACPGAVAALPARSPEHWRGLLSVPVDQLVADSLRALPAPSPVERRLPGRLGAMLPDRLHSWRRIGRSDVRPSVHLAYARQILTEWGWQNTPYRLRDARGARCVCGAMLTAHRLGYGSVGTVDRAGAWMITELRAQGWTDLIGPWNRAPGRTVSDALALIDATIRRASRAGD